MYNKYPLTTKVNTVAAVKAGVPVSDLKTQFGIPRSTIYGWLKDYNSDVEPASSEVLMNLGFELSNSTTELVCFNNQIAKKEEQPLVELRAHHEAYTSPTVNFI